MCCPKDLVSLFKNYHLWNHRKGRVGDETGTPGRSQTGFFVEFSLGNFPKAPAWLASPGQVHRVGDSCWKRGGSQQTGPRAQWALSASFTEAYWLGHF